MDPILFVLSVLAVAIAAAAILLPSEGRHPHPWDEEDLDNQLGASL